MSEFNEHAGYNCPENLPKLPNNPPLKVETIRAGATYGLPVYKVEYGVGLQQVGILSLQFVKGNKADVSSYYQEGITTESILIALQRYLQKAVQDLPSEDGNDALYHVSKALEATQRRAKDRAERNVLGTYEK